VTGDEFAEPLLPGEGDSDYERYLRTGELLALQKGEDEWAHRDELLFQTVHQSSELWLKLAAAEVVEATRLIAGGEQGGAIRLLRRANHCLRLVTDTLDMLEHLSPWEYQEIRKVLGHGSGFDSPGFRGVHEATPALGDAFRAACAAAGLTLLELYVHAREHEELYQLAEALIEWDERVTMWRIRHYKVVARIIGDQVVGTQGTPVEVLGKMIHHNFFPALWRARNQLTARAKQEEADEAEVPGHGR
jgi:tryptophan 2,3-dioxygenase